MPEPIEQLLQSAKKGDPIAEQELFRHLSVRFSLFLRHRIKDEEIRKDLAQEACLTVLSKYKSEQFTVGFEAWAHGVLRIVVLRHFEKLGKDKEKSIPLEDTPQIAETDSHRIETERRLIACLKKIRQQNLRYARVLNLIYQGYSTDEICRKLNCSRNNLYVIVNRGRSLLQECLERGEE
ncbi:MAG: RNA polymerase sigma factor [Candidatus Zixiibacteriota bacterium]